jgi:nitrate reductase NapAB chaperone NapD
MPAELHITSAVVQVRPEALASVRAQLATLTGVEVHAVAPTGKIVVTFETEDERQAMDRLDAIRAVTGTIDAAMVYHGIAPAEPNSEETPK